MKKGIKKLIIILAIVVFVTLVFLYVLTRPLIFVLLPSIPKDFIDRLSLPRVYSSGAIILSGDEEFLDKITKFKKPSFVLYTPFSDPPRDEYSSATWGNNERIKIDEEEMYRYYLENNSEKTVAFLVNTLDTRALELYNSLRRDFPNLEKVEYTDRITNINRDGILSSLDAFYSVIICDVINTKEAWNNTKARTVMRFENASSAISGKNVISITLDWDKIIKKLLDGEEKVKAEYKTRVLHR